jgi:phosphatidylinositol glycan class B
MQPKNFLVWTVLPFIIIHSLIHHKEERFLFPILNFLPVILIISYQELEKISVIKNLKYLKLIIAIPLVLINIAGLYAMSTKSAGVGRMEITKYIHDEYKDKQVNLISCQWSSPYNPWQSLPSKFYQEKNVINIQIKSLCSFTDSLINKSKVNLLVLRKAELNNPDCAVVINKMNCVKLKQSIPEWMEKANKYYSGIEAEDILILYLIK